MTELDKLDGLTAEDIAEINALFAEAAEQDGRRARWAEQREIDLLTQHRQEDDYEDRMYEETVAEWQKERS